MSEVQYRQDENGIYYAVIMDDEGNPLINSPNEEPINKLDHINELNHLDMIDLSVKKKRNKYKCN